MASSLLHSDETPKMDMRNAGKWRRGGLGAVLLMGALAWGLWRAGQTQRPGIAHLRRGEAYAAVGQIDRAEQEWQRGITADPTFPDCYARLGDLYSGTRNYAAAAEKYAAAVRLAPHDGATFLRLARVKQQTNDSRAALDAARRAALLLPADPEAQALRGRLARQTEALAEALAAMRAARNLRPDDRSLLLDVARLEQDTQDMAGAERDLTLWLQKHPEDVEACALMSLVYRHKPPTPENLSIGLGYARRGCAQMPPDALALVTAGQFFLDLKRPGEALKMYLAAANIRPNNEAVLQGLAECYSRLHRQGEAATAALRLKAAAARHERIDHLKRTLNASPGNVPAGLELARLEEQEGDLGEARIAYLKTLQQSPGDARIQQAFDAFTRRAEQSEPATPAFSPDTAKGAR